MILEKYFSAVMKIYRNYSIALAIADRGVLVRYKCIVAKRYVVRS